MFWMFWAFFHRANLSLFSENFKLVSQRKENPLVVRPVTRGKVLEMSPWSVRVGSAEGMILGGVLCLADIEVSIAKTETYDC